MVGGAGCRLLPKRGPDIGATLTAIHAIVNRIKISAAFKLVDRYKIAIPEKIFHSWRGGLNCVGTAAILLIAAERNPALRQLAALDKNALLRDRLYAYIANNRFGRVGKTVHVARELAGLRVEYGADVLGVLLQQFPVVPL